jgi:23S rRNA (uracil1939-C5)-methyltransferase
MPLVHISELSWGGEGIGRIEGKVIFVPFTLPGEVVETEVVWSKKNYCQGRLIRIIENSPDRVDPPCPFFRKCGGCQLQHLAPLSQIQEKERLFTAGLRHALKPEEIPVYPTWSSPSGFGYRHRLQLKTSWKNNQFNVGLFRPRSHEAVSIDRCLLANGGVNQILAVISGIIQPLRLENWSPDIEVQVFENPNKGGIVFSSSHRVTRAKQESIIKELRDLPGLTYIQFRDFSPHPVYGGGFSPAKDSPEYSLSASQTGLSKDLRISCFPGVFTQNNMDLNRRLITRLLSLNSLNADDTLLDLYSGLGNFSLPLALRVKEVIGLEVFPQAVANANWNRKINGIINCTFIEGKAENTDHLLKKHVKPVSWIILDPPRAGAKTIPVLKNWDLKGILYISCHPMTLFRDLRQLTSNGWEVQWSQPIDFFPQTFHLESLTLIKKLSR